MKKLRKFLLPLSWLYGAVLWCRNKGYDWSIFKSYKSDIKTIAVGNLSLGGTGKTPHIEYVLDLLKNKELAVLSRGYGRISKGTLLVDPEMDTTQSGDEPLQIARKFPQTSVIVDEDRRRGIHFIRSNFPNVELILLDDALQHRKIEAGLNILLTTFKNPFFKDYYLPAGNLRDHKIRAKDADIIILTKSPDTIPPSGKKKIVSRLQQYCDKVFFDKVLYKNIIPLFPNYVQDIESYKKVLVVTGIATPEYFLNAIRSKFTVADHFKYGDHYAFEAADLVRFRKFIGSFAPGEIAILTTEKDAIRLKNSAHAYDSVDLPIFYWEIGIDPGDDKTKLDTLILAYANKSE